MRPVFARVAPSRSALGVEGAGEHKMENNDDQVAALRRMTPAERLNAFFMLYRSARKIKGAALRQFHPDWSENQIQGAVRESFLHARS
jgi:hypothetical protein